MNSFWKDRIDRATGLLGIVLLSLPALSWAAVLTVEPGASIAATVRSARAGDTVLVQRGEYRERIIIDKPLTLEGVGKPTISGGFVGDVIRVRAPDVTIKGLIVRDSGIDQTFQHAGIYFEPGSHRPTVSDCDIIYNLFGVWVEKTDDARLISNTIVGRLDLQSVARGNGIQIYNSTGAQVLNNHISHTRDGIYVDLSGKSVFRGNRIHHLRYGTHYMNTHDSVWENNEVYLNRAGLALMEVRRLQVRHNIAWGNTDHGIMLRTIQDSVIEDNVVAGNGRGFFIYDAEYNTVRRNLVMNNQVGVHLSAGSANNRIDSNDFIGNRDQVKFVASRDVEWGKEQGNYWSNYGGWDQDGDGRGDVPYEANDVVDRLIWQYPLLKLLLTSPALHTLRFVARQYPVLRSPSVVDRRPRTRPLNLNWRKWSGTYPHPGE